MNVVDIILIIVLLLFLAKGFSNGVLKELVSFVGGVGVIVIAFLFKNPVSVFMYQNLPFFKLGGILSGISVLNIIIYEVIAFLLVATIFLLIYQLLLKVTNIFDKIIKITFILEPISKILGAIVGLVEGVIVAFIMLFIFIQFEFTRDIISESKYAEKLLRETPIIGEKVSPIYDSLKEIYVIADTYKDSENKEEANLESLNILLKYKVITPSNAQVLIDNNKLNMNGAQELVDSYSEGNQK